MAKEICSNCDAKMSRPVPFCPVCARPTPDASAAELVEWDLEQWRNHADRTGAVRRAPSSRSAVRTVEAPPPPAHVAPPAHVPPAVSTPSVAVVRTPEARAKRPRRERRPSDRGARRRLRSIVAPRPEEDRVIVLDADHEFVYTSCASCERGDWVVRTTRNEDGTFNYWCVRCSRAFKSDARIRNAVKPFLAAGSVIGAIVALSLVMR